MIEGKFELKPCINLLQGFFQKIDKEMATFEVKFDFIIFRQRHHCIYSMFQGQPKKLGLVTIVDFVEGVDIDEVKPFDCFHKTEKDIQVTNGIKSKLGELSTDYHKMKVVAITAIQNTTIKK